MGSHFVLTILLSILAATASMPTSSHRRSAAEKAIRHRLAAVHASTDHTHDVVELQKTIYSVLGQYEVPEIISRFHSEFKRLDVDGTLANTLDSLYEMRMLDMQISIQHAKKMRSVIDGLGHDR